jgi:hypothetical protein
MSRARRASAAASAAAAAAPSVDVVGAPAAKKIPALKVHEWMGQSTPYALEYNATLAFLAATGPLAAAGRAAARAHFPAEGGVSTVEAVGGLHESALAQEVVSEKSARFWRDHTAMLSRLRELGEVAGRLEPLLQEFPGGEEGARLLRASLTMPELQDGVDSALEVGRDFIAKIAKSKTSLDVVGVMSEVAVAKAMTLKQLDEKKSSKAKARSGEDDVKGGGGKGGASAKRGADDAAGAGLKHKKARAAAEASSDEDSGGSSVQISGGAGAAPVAKMDLKTLRKLLEKVAELFAAGKIIQRPMLTNAASELATQLGVDTVRNMFMTALAEDGFAIVSMSEVVRRIYAPSMLSQVGEVGGEGLVGALTCTIPLALNMPAKTSFMAAAREVAAGKGVKLGGVSGVGHGPAAALTAAMGGITAAGVGEPPAGLQVANLGQFANIAEGMWQQEAARSVQMITTATELIHRPEAQSSPRNSSLFALGQFYLQALEQMTAATATHYGFTGIRSASKTHYGVPAVAKLLSGLAGYGGLLVIEGGPKVAQVITSLGCALVAPAGGSGKVAFADGGASAARPSGVFSTTSSPARPAPPPAAPAAASVRAAEIAAARASGFADALAHGAASAAAPAAGSIRVTAGAGARRGGSFAAAGASRSAAGRRARDERAGGGLAPGEPAGEMLAWVATASYNGGEAIGHRLPGKACLYDGKMSCAGQDLSRKHPGYIPLPYIEPGCTRTQLLAVYPPSTASAAAAAGKT